MRTKASAKIMEKKMTSFDDFIDDHDASDCLTYPQFFLIVQNEDFFYPAIL